MKFWRIWLGYMKLAVSAEMAYRFHFLLKTMAYFTFDIFGPLLAFVIYETTRGLPGWTFGEFLLLQGTFILSHGLFYLLFARFAGDTIEKVRQGNYDIDLVKPSKPLLLGLATGADLDGLPRTFVGAGISAYALLQLGWAFNFANLFAYSILVIAAVIFLLSLNIMVAAMSFLFVKTYTLYNIIEILVGIGKHPLSIFGALGSMLFTFVLPIGLSAFYPASAILGELSITQTGSLVFVALAFFGLSVLLWHQGIKKYASAGG